MSDTFRCYRCDYENRQPAPHCPQCGGRLLPIATIRRLGWVLVLIGGFLVAFMGGLSFVVARIIFWPKADATSEFTGETQDAILIFSLFYTVIAFGLVALACGISQIRNGRRNRKLVRLAGGLALLLYAFGMTLMVLS